MRSENKLVAESGAADQMSAPLTWAERRKRVFYIDLAVSPLCGGSMHVIADMTDPDIIQKILDHIRGRLGHNHHRLNLRQLSNPKTSPE